MPALKTFTRKHHAQALRMLRAGKSDKEVAATFGVKPDTIYRFKKRMDFESPSQKSRRREIRFFVSEDEFAAFSALSEEAGCKTNAAFARILVRSAAGFLEVSRHEAEELAEIRRELSKIGTNVNQVAWAANARKIDLVKTQWNELQQLRTDIGSLRTFMNAFVAETRRRGSRLWRKSEYGHE